VTADRDDVAGLQRLRRPTATNQRVRAAELEVPGCDLAAVTRDVHFEVRVRIRPKHFLHGALERDWLLRVELGRERVVREDGNLQNQNGGDQREVRGPTTHACPSHLPTKCSRSELFSQRNSRMDSLGASSATRLNVHGFASTAGSSTVI